MSTTPSGVAPAAGAVQPPTVGDLMRPPTTTVEAGAHVAAAAYLMKRSGDSALVVTTNDSLRAPVGLITDSDISQAVADGRDLEGVRISDILSVPTLDVAPGTPVVEALRKMLEGRVHHLLVVSSGGLVGIVEMTDLCGALVDVPAPWRAEPIGSPTTPPAMTAI
jgi:CBS domain-containing protein